MHQIITDRLPEDKVLPIQKFLFFEKDQDRFLELLLQQANFLKIQDFKTEQLKDVNP